MINPHFHNVKSTILGLRREVSALRTRTSQGMVKASKMIMQDAQDNTPFDTGNLRASAFVVWKKGYYRRGQFTKRKGITSGQRKDVERLRREHAQVVAESKGRTGFRDVVIGFSTYYAKLIHNAPAGTNLRYGEREFLIRSVNRNRKKALAMIREYAQHGTTVGRKQ